VTDPVIDKESQAWLDQTRVLLKASTAKKSARKGLDKEVKALDVVFEKLQVANAVRYDRLSQERHDLAKTTFAAARTADADKLAAAAEAIRKLIDKANAEIKAQDAFLTDAKAFDKAYAKLEIEVAETAGLRGARTAGTPVHTRLSAASSLMQDALDRRRKADTEASNAVLKEAAGFLDLIRAKLGEAKTDGKAADKSTKEYLAAMKEWGTLESKARDTLQKIRELAGAAAIADDLQTRLGTAQGGIKNVDGVFTGHVEAVKLIGDLDATLNKARVANTAHLAKTLPKVVVSAMTATQVDIDAHALLVPPYVAKAVRDEALQLTEQGRHDMNAATAGLAALSTRLKNEIRDQQRDKTAAETAVKTFETTIASLQSLAVPPGLYAGLKRAGDAARQSDIVDRQWVSATQRLTDATQGLKLIEKRYNELGPKWKQCKAELENVHKEAGGLIAFPAVRQAANALREQAHAALLAFAGDDLQTAIDAHAKATVGKPPQTLVKALDELIKQAKAKGIPVGDDTKRVQFTKGLSEAIALVREKAETARAALRSQLDGNRDLTPAQRRLLEIHCSAQVDKVEADWLAFHQASGSDLKALEKEARARADQLDKLVKDQSKLKPNDLDSTVRKLEQDEKKSFEANMPKWIGEGIDRLAGLGEDVSKERQALTAASSQAQPRVALDKLADIVRKKLDARNAARAEQRDKTRASLVEKVDEPLKKLPISKVYREELQRESYDTLSMIASDDPDLLAVAQDKLNRQAKLIAQIAAQPQLYDGNKTRLEKLGARLREMHDVLPDTFRMLQTKLTQLFVDTKHTDPIAMGKLIDAFQTEVAEKEVELAARKKAIEDQYRPLKKSVLDTWERLEQTVWHRDTPKAFKAYYDARIADASALKSSEAPIANVLLPLKDLKAKLDSVATATNKKAAIEKLDAAQVADQRQVRDMAAQFERELKAFKEITVGRAKAAAKGDEDGDTDLASSLSGVASAASKVVSPYLKLLGTLPHETRGAVPAPDMQRMKSDFERARALLADAVRTAERLIETPSTTNVTGPSKDGLRKLLPKWAERSQAYATAVRAVATAIRSAAAEVPNPDPNPAQTAATKVAAEKAAKLVEGLSGTFRSDAFATSFAGLLAPLPADKSDKSGREKVERQHLASREDALRVMRQYRTELTENKLRRMLTDAAVNPFEAASLMAAAGALRVTLKEIELQALDSV